MWVQMQSKVEFSYSLVLSDSLHGQNSIETCILEQFKNEKSRENSSFLQKRFQPIAEHCIVCPVFYRWIGL